MTIEVNNIESLRKKRREGITFFVPCLNEEKDIANTLNTIKTAVDKVGIEYEVLVFDDCSNDNSVSQIKDFGKVNPDMPIILIEKMKTMGLGHNYADGSYIAEYMYYMIIFGDNSTTVEIIKSSLINLGEAEIIIPYFNQKHRPFFRRLLSISFTFLVNLLSNNSIHYYNWSVVHLTNNVMRWHSDSHGFGFQAELITRLLDDGATYFEFEGKAHFKKEQSSALKFKNIASVSHSLLQVLLRKLRKAILDK